MAIAASELGSRPWVRHAPGSATSARHLAMLGGSSLAVASLVLIASMLMVDHVRTWLVTPHLVVGSQWLERCLTVLFHSLPIMLTTAIFIATRWRQTRTIPAVVRRWCGAAGGTAQHQTQETDDMVPITAIHLDDSTTAAAQVAVQNLTTFTVRHCGVPTRHCHRPPHSPCRCA